MNHSRLCLIVGLTALVFVAQGQLSPSSPSPRPDGKRGHSRELSTDDPTFRVSGSTTSQRRSNGRRHSPGARP